MSYTCGLIGRGILQTGVRNSIVGKAGYANRGVKEAVYGNSFSDYNLTTTAFYCCSYCVSSSAWERNGYRITSATTNNASRAGDSPFNIAICCTREGLSCSSWEFGRTNGGWPTKIFNKAAVVQSGAISDTQIVYCKVGFFSVSSSWIATVLNEI